jgi:uncharacterized protein YdhG (YjbR/CyaY superfamily)
MIIDEYLHKFPKESVSRMQMLRKTIHKIAPKAQEAFSYGVPAFKLNGNTIMYAAFKKHIGLYPDPETIKKFKKDLKGYEQSKGTIKFPLDEPLPIALISKIVKYKLLDKNSS